ncbi:MAG: hypothetical protein ACRDHM_06310, partial [Actinomycetota bacterium]
STNGAAAGEAEVPVAVFAMHPDALGPVSAVVVIPSADGRQAEVASILDGRTLYTMPFPPQPDVSMTAVSGGA